MISVFINVGAVLLGGTVGLFFNRSFPQHIADTVMKGLALCVLYIGISGALEGNYILVTILSVALGGALGEWLDLDGKLNRLGQKLEQQFGGKENAAEGRPRKSLAEGFVSASMLFCVGAMAIVGSLQSGLVGDHSTIIAKSLIDGIAAVLLASSLGGGRVVFGRSGFALSGQHCAAGGNPGAAAGRSYGGGNVLRGVLADCGPGAEYAGFNAFKSNELHTGRVFANAVLPFFCIRF